MTSSVERLAVEPAPRRKAKADAPVWLPPPLTTPTQTTSDVEERLIALQTRRPPDLEPITDDVARANRLIAEMAQRVNDQTDAINELKARPVAPSRMSEHVLGALRAVAMVLAVRFLLLLSLFGTFVLAVMAMTHQTVVSLALTAAFAVLTLVPLVVLEVRHRPQPPTP